MSLAWLILAASQNSLTQTVLMALGVLIVGAVMLRAARQRVARMQREQPTTFEQRVKAAKSADTVRGQLDDLMVQLEELARTTSAQIETRFSKLDVLLHEADRKIARLESLLSTVEQPPTPGQIVYTDTVRPEHRRIYDLADAGRPAVEIAKEVGRDVGEVELILALRKKN